MAGLIWDKGPSDPSDRPDERIMRFLAGRDIELDQHLFLFDIEGRLRRHYNAGHEFDLPMSHEDIANYLRLSPETVSRRITKLQEAGVIDAHGKHIRILDIAGLGRIAQGG